MSNPKLEKGYTKIANELLDALALHRIPGEVRQIIDVIIRKTYGYNKKHDTISISQFALMTGQKKPSVIRNLKKAMMHNLISKNANGKFSFQKDYTIWKPFTKVLTAVSKSANGVSKSANELDDFQTEKTNQKPLAKVLTTNESVSKSANESLAKVLPTKEIKDNITKENNIYISSSPTKKPSSKQQFDFEAVWKMYPRRLGKKHAIRHFTASVKTQEDYENLKKAIKNYVKYIQEKGIEEQFIKHGSTFFNNWQDYVNLYDNIKSEEEIRLKNQVEKILGRPVDISGEEWMIAQMKKQGLKTEFSETEKQEAIQKLQQVIQNGLLKAKEDLHQTNGNGANLKENAKIGI